MQFLKLLKWRSIIGLALALLLSACGLLRIGYLQAPNLAYWWIDGYVDLDEAQTPKLRDAIDQWFEWHRRTEMPAYAALLQRAQREVMEPSLSAQQLCVWRDEAQRRLDAGLDRATPAVAALMLTLTPQQIQHMERKLAKNGEEMRADFLQPDRAVRKAASFKRTLERYENLYGKLDEAQRARLGELLAASPFDAERWLAERDRRNRDLVDTLVRVGDAGRKLDAATAQAQAQAAVRLIAERALRSPRPEYRAYQQRLTDENCSLASAMHNLTTAEQRLFARDKLKAWENEVRAIANGDNGSGSGNGSAVSR
jgi:Family of unknown function (DUF6279)